MYHVIHTINNLRKNKWIWIHNDVNECRKIKKADLTHWLDLGWKEGHSENCKHIQN